MTSTEAVERFPLGAALKLAELERCDNAPLLHRLREREPVTWFAEQGVWLVTSKALFDELQMDPERFVVDVLDNPQRVVLGRQMLVVDGEEHARHRGPFAEPFKYSPVRRQFADLVTERVDYLLGAMDAGADSGAAELGVAFANPFAVSVASDVLGLGLEQVEEVHDIYTTFAAGMVGYRDPGAVARAAQGRARLDELLAPRIERLGSEPDDSMLAAAIHGGAAGWRTREELLANLRLILFGAIETVESMILNTTWALLLHSDQVRLLTADPDLWPGVVQEGLRWVPPVGYTDRWASVDTELGGVPIARGDYLIGVIHAANRDPATFPDPDRFDITRDVRRQNFSFGKGIHMCLGVNLARLQGAIALRSLFERLPGLRLDPAHPSEPEGFNFRRPPHLQVLWDR
ncbi:MAG: cytochrome P450 [Solirubrobacteraceae bacterium]